VLTIDISSDNKILISGSADKNIKIWGLDFGNCHKSIFAHAESISQVQFVKDTHYFFSCSKDRTVKFWDGDTFELVQSFEECQGEVWCLSVSSIGDFFIAGSADKSMRFWKQTKEQIIVQDEKLKRQEKEIIQNYAKEQFENINDDENLGKVLIFIYTFISQLNLNIFLFY